MVERISGINSGMDIDGLVAKLMKTERMPIDKLTQKKQLLTWKAQAYRDINLKVASFRDALNNMRFSGDMANSKVTSSDTSKVNVSVSGKATPGTQTISVSQLATAATVIGTAGISQNKQIESSNISAGADIKSAWSNNKFSLTLNGVTKDVVIADGEYDNDTKLAAAVQLAIDTSFGANKVSVSNTGGKLQLSPKGDPAFLPQLKINASAGNIGIDAIGFVNNQSYKIDPAATFASESGKYSAALSGTFFTINNQKITYTDADSLTSIINKINSSNAGVTATYDSINDKISLKGKETGVTSQINFGASDGNMLGILNLSSSSINSAAGIGNVDQAATFASESVKYSAPLTGSYFTINNQQINYTSSDSLDSIMSKIELSNAGVTATYDSVNKKISLKGKETGEGASQVMFGASDGNMLDILKLSSATITQGQNALVKIDGVDGSYSSNSFTNNGVSYTVLGETTGVTVGVTSDDDKLFNQLKDFVTKYNDLLGTINTALSESKFKDFKPLSSEQKKDMSESEIKTWEEKAKSGLLMRDTDLVNLRNSLRDISLSTVTSVASSSNALYKIGIAGGAYAFGKPSEAGKLEIDEDALRKAISDDPQGVISLFTAQSSSPVQSGIFQQMYTLANKSITSLTENAGKPDAPVDLVTNTVGKQVSDINAKMASLNVKLQKKEDYYYLLFAKMDSAVGKSNSQLSWMNKNMA
ncbi:flagellar filament capping protein FliD [Cohnella abietis]|uniref:Flagellar hook-associated protein 2 n=1 Tax=Cohnella abietis TaxID=2507935 RepID=A0A3T1DEH0_9BACL|nr:flagellar filament capping protein FliD [Cohnella abietis]BBI36424.1 hypothetical protein KCTCHS21_58230 [Cohnella abietis]